MVNIYLHKTISQGFIIANDVAALILMCDKTEAIERINWL